METEVNEAMVDNNQNNWKGILIKISNKLLKCLSNNERTDEFITNKRKIFIYKNEKIYKYVKFRVYV